MARISAVTKAGRKLSPGELLERQVTAQVKDYLLHRGWRPIRFQRTVVPGSFQAGEPGMPDFLFVRYLDCKVFCGTLSVWVEFKKPNGKLRDGQPQWHERERRRGGVVWVIDNFDSFLKDYERVFGWLHSGDAARGQLDLLAGMS